ncbi:DNA-binding transcriptional MerR regulator [Breznakia sp. PF5-3]|uniref:MerR family transcriptional regulator n=1 Tax=unclassified Breznakia TaxID=2623764 RepID=UPI00240758E4|nr:MULTISPECIES: MerR family transcriptional regulator [unclassified Breznakia]MDF9825270.1 DNA-binding transcriptional MerR regulator [Breznakia sp. PM6-1]MDF9836140.1 DNA-binding transcriptional MerR regulator [Breznakia sp. PF5-3]MDF9838173.1 DNA-binding transcriptional MerR regulator [Breznakia sp. PFB2-8]MDF9860159.1 DNA-binding transcriptional MerR regulator [Breznakia sp. PH5-24]
MFKIGEFSKLSQVSGRMLRHFDQIDILKPEQIDENGYRLYSSFQLEEIMKITALQKAGFQLQEIKQLLDDNLSEIEKQEIIKICKERKQQEYTKVKKSLSLLEDVEHILTPKKRIRPYLMELKMVPKHMVASLRKRIPYYSEEGILWRELYNEMYKHHVSITEKPRKVAIYHDDEYMEEHPDVEIQLSIDSRFDGDEVICKEVAEQQVLSITFYGEYEQIGNVNMEAIKWMEENNYRLDGKFYSVYHMGIDSTKESEEWKTECCFPVKRI